MTEPEKTLMRRLFKLQVDRAYALGFYRLSKSSTRLEAELEQPVYKTLDDIFEVNREIRVLQEQLESYI